MESRRSHRDRPAPNRFSRMGHLRHRRTVEGMRVPCRRRRNLADRLRPYVRPLPASEPMVSADPIRMFLYRWMIETGDPVELMAKGFDVDATTICELLSGERSRITKQEAILLRSRLSLDRDDRRLI